MSLFKRLISLATLAEQEPDERKRRGYLKQICTLTAEFMIR